MDVKLLVPTTSLMEKTKLFLLYSALTTTEETIWHALGSQLLTWCEVLSLSECWLTNSQPWLFQLFFYKNVTNSELQFVNLKSILKFKRPSFKINGKKPRQYINVWKLSKRFVYLFTYHKLKNPNGRLLKCIRESEKIRSHSPTIAEFADTL